MTDTMTRPPTFSGNDDPPPAPPADRGPQDDRSPHDDRGPRRWPRRVAGGAAALALVAGGGTAGGVVAERYLIDHPATTVTTTTAASSATGSATTGSATTGSATTGSLAAVAAAVEPGIVTVTVDSDNSESLGSGVVLSSTGLILTNNHVVSGSGQVSVRLSTGRTVPATVAATDTAHDLALVQATGLTGLTPVTFASSSTVAVGDTVLAFGAPLGLSGTVTSGIVSALNRSVDTGTEKLTGLLQTDAPINEGNSGGALVDTAGDVIGINVAIATTGAEDTGSVGLGFAIPSSTVVSAVNALQAQLK